MRRILWAPALLVVLAAGACGGSHHAATGASPSAAGSFERFASCMRSHGQNVPDPDPNSGETTLSPPTGADRAGWDAAMRSCQRYLPGGGQAAAPDAQQLAALRSYAVCMRSHGIELTDPDPATGKSQFQGRLANASRDQIANDPGFKAADAACQVRLKPSPGSKGSNGSKGSKQ